MSQTDVRIMWHAHLFKIKILNKKSILPCTYFFESLLISKTRYFYTCLLANLYLKKSKLMTHGRDWIFKVQEWVLIGFQKGMSQFIVFIPFRTVVGALKVWTSNSTSKKQTRISSARAPRRPRSVHRLAIRHTHKRFEQHTSSITVNCNTAKID